MVEQQIVNGVIYSSDGDLVEDAMITFSSISNETKSVENAADGGVKISATSNYRGEYYAEVMSGYYKVTVSKSGYKTYEDSVTVEDGVYELDVTLINDVFESSSVPSISLSDHEYKPNIPVELNIINVNSTDIIRWHINGELVTNLVTSFERGEYTIKAEVTRSKYVKYVVVKKIVVK